jgi:hypothetical protein
MNEWISYECSDEEGTCTLSIRNSSTRSRASEFRRMHLCSSGSYLVTQVLVPKVAKNVQHSSV